MVIGGYGYDYYYSRNRRNTFFFDIQKKRVSKGPKMVHGRSDHACSEMTIDGKEYIVVVGGDKRVEAATELLSKATWKQTGWQTMEAKSYLNGKHPIFWDLTEYWTWTWMTQMVPANDKQSLYIMFGYKYGGRLADDSRVFKFSCRRSLRTCKWVPTGTKLKFYDRWQTRNFLISDELANKVCNLDGATKY